MKEIRQLIFSVISNDAGFLSLVGGEASDPRIYWQYAHQRVSITDTKPAYAEFYRSGTVRLAVKVNIAQKDDQVYVVEICGKTPDLCDDVADMIVELFREKSFSTSSYNVLYTYGTVLGSPQLDDGRKLFTLSVNLYLTKIMKK